MSILNVNLPSESAIEGSMAASIQSDKKKNLKTTKCSIDSFGLPMYPPVVSSNRITSIAHGHLGLFQFDGFKVFSSRILMDYYTVPCCLMAPGTLVYGSSAANVRRYAAHLVIKNHV